MNILRDVFAELVGMFLGDLRLSLAVLGTVILAAVLIDIAGAPALLGGAVLLVGCLLIAFGAVQITARRARAAAAPKRD
ncbi:hypothetical protein [Acuticoccus kandeliae]|uniref:hypothetical protein n=1 Tax=Acuticoccus kandeliae TaxID=2073160 RepID=UPI000D3E4377|nr:hypothetical protein [Acuticoccus kandeliae]